MEMVKKDDTFAGIVSPTRLHTSNPHPPTPMRECILFVDLPFNIAVDLVNNELLLPHFFAVQTY